MPLFNQSTNKLKATQRETYDGQKCTLIDQFTLNSLCYVFVVVGLAKNYQRKIEITFKLFNDGASTGCWIVPCDVKLKDADPGVINFRWVKFSPYKLFAALTVLTRSVFS